MVHNPHITWQAAILANYGVFCHSCMMAPLSVQWKLLQFTFKRKLKRPIMKSYQRTQSRFDLRFKIEILKRNRNREEPGQTTSLSYTVNRFGWTVSGLHESTAHIKSWRYSNRWEITKAIWRSYLIFGCDTNIIQKLPSLNLNTSTNDRMKSISGFLWHLKAAIRSFERLTMEISPQFIGFWCEAHYVRQFFECGNNNSTDTDLTISVCYMHCFGGAQFLSIERNLGDSALRRTYRLWEKKVSSTLEKITIDYSKLWTNLGKVTKLSHKHMRYKDFVFSPLAVRFLTWDESFGTSRCRSFSLLECYPLLRYSVILTWKFQVYFLFNKSLTSFSAVRLSIPEWSLTLRLSTVWPSAVTFVATSPPAHTPFDERSINERSPSTVHLIWQDKRAVWWKRATDSLNQQLVRQDT